MLQARASLLLADVTCVQGTVSATAKPAGSREVKSSTVASADGHVVGEDMVGVFQGLSAGLQDQVHALTLRNVCLIC